MSTKRNSLPAVTSRASNWSGLLDEMKDEYWASEELTEAEKRYLDELETLPEAEWEPVSCSGSTLSELIIAERGER
ncbi:MAG TPA: hypothetical protein VFZ34_01600 [Blastocatellia bacterium]|nr:hypothetical protein [Blastocatellia bacterium]